MDPYKNFHRMSMVIAERPFEDGRIVMYSRGTGNYVNYEDPNEWSSIGQSTGTSRSLHAMSANGKVIAVIGTEDGLDWLIEGNDLIAYSLPDVYPLSYRHQKFGGDPERALDTHSLVVAREGDPRLYLLPAHVLAYYANGDAEWDPEAIYDYLSPVSVENTLNHDVLRSDESDRFINVPSSSTPPEGMRHVREVIPPTDERYDGSPKSERIEFLVGGPIDVKPGGHIRVTRTLVRNDSGKRVGFLYSADPVSRQVSVYLHGGPDLYDFGIRETFLDSRARMALLLRSGNVFIPFIPHSADFGSVRRITMNGGIGGAENIRWVSSAWASEAYGEGALSHLWGKEMVEIGEFFGEVIVDALKDRDFEFDCTLSDSLGGFIALSMLFGDSGIKAREHHLVNPLVNPEDTLLSSPATEEAKRDFYGAITEPYDSRRIITLGIDMEEAQNEDWVNANHVEDGNGWVGLPVLYFYLGEDDPICPYENATNISNQYIGPAAAMVYPGEEHELGSAFAVDVVQNLLP